MSPWKEALVRGQFNKCIRSKRATNEVCSSILDAGRWNEENLHKMMSLILRRTLRLLLFCLHEWTSCQMDAWLICYSIILCCEMVKEGIDGCNANTSVDKKGLTECRMITGQQTAFINETQPFALQAVLSHQLLWNGRGHERNESSKSHLLGGGERKRCWKFTVWDSCAKVVRLLNVNVQSGNSILVIRSSNSSGLAWWYGCCIFRGECKPDSFNPPPPKASLGQKGIMLFFILFLFSMFL